MCKSEKVLHAKFDDCLTDERGCCARWKRGVLSFYGIKEMGAREWFEQLPLFAAVSIGSGLLGALFNTLHKALLTVRPPAFCTQPPHLKCTLGSLMTQ